MQPDPYKTLGISKTATQDEIKNAYRSLAKKLHPDLNPGNKTAEVKFKEINSAYELLGTPEARTKFDHGEAQEEFKAHQGPFYYQTQEGGGRYSSNFGGEEFGQGGFEDLFRNFRQQQRQESKGEDQLYRMDVDFKDSILGAEREITLNTGKKLRVKIPPGIESGKRLRFKGQGMPGVNGAAAGDAYIEVEVRPSPVFKRSGKNLEIEVPVGIADAVLGGDVEVPTLDGTVMLHIPPGVSSGAKLRIRGKGVPSQGERTQDERGDEIVSVRIVVPKIGDPELLELQAALRNFKNKAGGSNAA